ncbi:MAG: hypothetical protein Kow0059_19760 [Candidatus Sumerlaeia bacterium]
MKLKSILTQQSPATLKSIADYWHIDLPEPAPGKSEEDYQRELAEYLYHRMQNKALFEQAFANLDEKERELIHFLIIHSGDMGIEELTRRFAPARAKKLDNLIEGLTAKGFVFLDRIRDDAVQADLVGVPEPFVRHIDLPPYWDGYLGYFLQELPLRKIRQIALDGLQIKNPSPLKHALIHQIRSVLLDPQQLAQHIQSLSPEEREVLTALLTRKGFCVYRDLLDTGYQKRYDHAKAEHVNSLLNRSGLLFIAIPNENKYNSLLMMPKDIYHIITNNYTRDDRDLKELDTVSAFGDDATPAVTADNSFNLLRDLVICVAEIGKGKCRRLAGGGIGKNELRKILPAVSAHKTEKYIHFLADFAISRKFLVAVGDTWQVSDRFQEWLEDPFSVYDELIEWWLGAAEWNEEYIDGSVIGLGDDTARLINAPELRKKVLSSLGSLPPHRWIDFSGYADTFLPEIESSIPRRSNAVSLDRLGRTNYFTIESVIGECCFWLGLVRLGAGDVKGLVKIGNRGGGIGKATPATRRKRVEKALSFYFRLTDIGECLVRNLQETGEGRLNKSQYPDLLMQLSEGAEHFVLQPNLEIIAPPDLNLQKLYRLCQFTDVKKVDIMTTLEINKESVRQALERGLDGEEVLKFLAESNRGAVPDTVHHLITEIEKKHGEINISLSSGYIKTSDPVIFEALRRNRRFRDAIKDACETGILILQPGLNIQKFTADLQKAGFAPRIESEDVQVGRAGRLMVSLTNEEFLNLVAILNLVQMVEQELGESITEDKAIQLIEKLKGDAHDTKALSTFGLALSRSFHKRFMGLFSQRIDQKTKKYKKQISRLMETVPRSSNKYDFDGPNPAKEKADIRKMLDFAVKHELPIEIRYLNRHEEEIRDVLEPESVDGNKIYGYFKQRDDYSVVRFDQIVQTRLV